MEKSENFCRKKGLCLSLIHISKYAYIRVSSKDQNIARQVEAMQEVGLTKKQMYIDKQSGKDFIRKNYQRLIRKLKAGDELYIKSIDLSLIHS